MENKKVMKLPYWKKIMYALGQLGWSLTSFAVGNTLVYFYMPPENGESIFPAFFYQGQVIGVLTIIGLIFAVGRLFDAVTDPVIAGMSDRGKFKFGRRRTFLAVAIVPFSILSALVFFPPVESSSPMNAIFVTVMVLAFYLFMTMYVTPYFALLSEIGHTAKERLHLSTMISITWAFGFAIGSQVYALKSMFQDQGHDPVAAFQITIVIFAVIGFLFMLLPIIFIDESKYCESHISEEGIFQAVGSAFKNRNFRRFTISDLAYWVSMTIIATGLVYYVTVLLGQPEENVSSLQLMMFGLSFLFYVPTNLIAQKIGKKKLLIIGFVIFIMTYVITASLGFIPGLNEVQQGYLLIVFAAVPLAIFGILPNAIVADIAEADGIENGNFKAGIFFGARTFMQKMGQSLAGIIFPSLLLLGNSAANSTGIRLTAVAAIIFLVMGLVIFMMYNEKSINQTLATKED